MNSKKLALKGKIPGEFKKKKVLLKLSSPPPSSTQQQQQQQQSSTTLSSSHTPHVAIILPSSVGPPGVSSSGSVSVLSSYFSNLSSSVYTSLTPADIREILASAKEMIFDFSTSCFQLDSDDFLMDPGFADAREIDLSGNCLTKFVAGHNLGKLKHFSVENNNLVDFQFSGLKSLVSLSVARNRIQTLNDMSDLAKLVNLDLSNNRIIGGWNQLQKLKGLKVLDLGTCRIDLPPAEFQSILLGSLKTLPKLQFLNLSGNPVENSLTNFKYLIIHELPELKYFNWELITKEDKNKAAVLAQENKWSSSSITIVKKQTRQKRTEPRQATSRRNTPQHHQTKVPDSPRSIDEGNGDDDNSSLEDNDNDGLDDYYDQDVMVGSLEPDQKFTDEQQRQVPTGSTESGVSSLRSSFCSDPSIDVTTSFPAEIPSILESDIGDIDAWLETAFRETRPRRSTLLGGTIRSKALSIPGLRDSMDFDTKLETLLSVGGGATTTSISPTKPVPPPAAGAPSHSSPSHLSSPATNLPPNPSPQLSNPILNRPSTQNPSSHPPSHNPPLHPSHSSVQSLSQPTLPYLSSSTPPNCPPPPPPFPHPSSYPTIPHPSSLNPAPTGEESSESSSIGGGTPTPASASEDDPNKRILLGRYRRATLTRNMSSGDDILDGILEMLGSDVYQPISTDQISANIDQWFPSFPLAKEPAPTASPSVSSTTTPLPTITATSPNNANTNKKLNSGNKNIDEEFAELLEESSVFPSNKTPTTPITTQTSTPTPTQTSMPTPTTTQTSTPTPTTPTTPTTTTPTTDTKLLSSSRSGGMALNTDGASCINSVGSASGGVGADIGSGGAGVQFDIQKPETFKTKVTSNKMGYNLAAQAASVVASKNPNKDLPHSAPPDSDSGGAVVPLTKEPSVRHQPITNITSFSRDAETLVRTITPRSVRPVVKEVTLKEPDPWDAGPTEFVLANEMGKGTYGVSHLGQWRRHEGLVVIKRLFSIYLPSHIDQPPTPTEIEAENSKFKEECKRLMSISHPALVKLLGASVTTEKFIFWEYFDSGMDLKRYMKDKLLSSRLVLCVARSVASCVVYLHKEEIIHGAIKTRNIIVVDDKSLDVRLTDYGFMDAKDNVPIEEADPQYFAPELFSGEAYREKIDVYSYAMVLYEMVSGKQPFQDIQPNNIAHIVVDRRLRPNLPIGTPEPYAQLVQKCWTNDPLARLSFSQINQRLNDPDQLVIPEHITFPITTVPRPVVPAAAPAPAPVTLASASSATVTTAAGAATAASVSTIPVHLSSKSTLPPLQANQPTSTPQQPSARMTMPLKTFSHPKIPSKPEAEIYSPPAHTTFMSPDDITTLLTLLEKLKKMLQSNITVHQIKAINALIQVASTPGRLFHIAKHDILQSICSILSLAGQIGKFELVEQTIMVITDFGVYPVVAERLCLPQNRTLPSLISILSTDDASLVLKSAVALRTLAIAHPPCADAIRLAGGLSRLIQLLKTNNINTQTAALVALMGFLVSPTNTSTFLQTPGFSDLESLARSRTAQLRLNAMETLMYFMGLPQVRPKIEEMNFKDIFLKSINLQNVLIKETGLRSLAKMLQLHPESLSDSEKNLIIPECVKILAAEELLTLLVPSSSIIFRIITHSSPPVLHEQFSKLFLNSNGIGALLRHVESTSDTLRVQVFEILDIVFDMEEPKQNFVNMGGLASLTISLGHWDTRIRLLALKCLVKLLQGIPVDFVIQSDIIPSVASVLGFISETEEVATAADIICILAQLPDDAKGTMSSMLQLMRQNGVLESLLHVLQTETDETTIESALFAVSVLSQYDIFRPALVQTESFQILTNHLKGDDAIKERVAWTLSNIGSLDYGCHIICTTILVNLLELLESKSDIVISSSLRAILSIARKPSYLHYLKECDPTLFKLKSIQNHPTSNIQGVANKLVQILSKN